MVKIIEFPLSIEIDIGYYLQGKYEVKKELWKRINNYINKQYILIKDFYEFKIDELQIIDNLYNENKTILLAMKGILNEVYFNECELMKKRLEIGL